MASHKKQSQAPEVVRRTELSLTVTEEDDFDFDFKPADFGSPPDKSGGKEETADSGQKLIWESVAKKTQGDPDDPESIASFSEDEEEESKE